MRRSIPERLVHCATTVLCAVLLALNGGTALGQNAALPARLTDAEFWKIVVDMSEPDGSFGSDNFVSNETMFQYAIPTLLGKTKPGNVYLGVGPEQNLTYIANLKPSMAIIFDIRRGNLHMHLLYKALFELSANRAEFVSRLFSKPMPASLSAAAKVDSIFDAVWFIPTDSVRYQRNLQEVTDLLVRKHGFALTTADIAGIRYVYDAFFYGGPGMEYGGPFGSRGRYPSYATLMMETDGQMQRSFLASDANFRFLKDLHARNMLVPVVGDFAGPKAIRSVGAWLKARNAKVQAFYVSNVEQYLFQSRRHGNFYDNVATLPLDESSMYIRGDASGGRPELIMVRANKTCSIVDQLLAHRNGLIGSYETAMALCK